LHMQNDMVRLLESVSRSLVRSKAQMDALLVTWEKLGCEQFAKPSHLEALRHARQILNDCEDLPTFLSALREDAATSTSPLTELVKAWSPAVSGRVFTIAALVAGTSGYFGWPWCIPLAAGGLAILTDETPLHASLSQDMTPGFHIRSSIMTAVLMGISWTLGFTLSQLS
jgi:hypothetical protein